MSTSQITTGYFIIRTRIKIRKFIARFNVLLLLLYIYWWSNSSWFVVRVLRMTDVTIFNRFLSCSTHTHNMCKRTSAHIRSICEFGFGVYSNCTLAGFIALLWIFGLFSFRGCTYAQYALWSLPLNCAWPRPIIEHALRFCCLCLSPPISSKLSILLYEHQQ